VAPSHMNIHIQASDLLSTFHFFGPPFYTTMILSALLLLLFSSLELEEDVADETLDHYEPLPSTSRGRSEADIALDRAMVFRYDAALDLVFKEEFTEQPADQEGEENVQQPQQHQTGVDEPRRKRPRYGNYELLFPESEESDEQEREQEEAELQTNRRRRRPSTPAAAPEQLPFNHPAIKKDKGRSSTNHGDN